MGRKTFLPARAKKWKVEIDGREAFVGSREEAEEFAEQEAKKRRFANIRLLPVREEKRRRRF